MPATRLVLGGLDRAPDLVVQSAVWWKGRGLARRRFGRGFVSELERAKAASVLSVDETRHIQIDVLRRLLTVAARESPYYRRIFRGAGLECGDIAALDDISKLPLLRRDDVAEFGEEMLVRAPSRGDERHHTSGSTGRRLDFWLPGALKYRQNAAHLYGLYDWFGFSPGMSRVTLGGRYLGNRAGGRIVHNPHEHQLVLGSHGLSEQSVPKYISAIQRFAPVAVQGHPSVIARLVSIAHRLDLAVPRVPLVFVTGEELTPEYRNSIRSGFSSAHVVNMYGNGENAVMASECPGDEGLHVDEMFSYVELVPRSAGLYEIVATSLLNDLMPFVRYATGDLTRGWVEGACSCGRTWRRLDDVIGRIDDTITVSSDRVILPVELRTAVAASVRDAPAYKVVISTASQCAQVILYDDGRTSPATSAAIVETVRRVLPCEWDVRVRHACQCEGLSSGGKRRIVEVLGPGKGSL